MKATLSLKVYYAMKSYMYHGPVGRAHLGLPGHSLKMLDNPCLYVLHAGNDWGGIRKDYELLVISGISLTPQTPAAALPLASCGCDSPIYQGSLVCVNRVLSDLVAFGMTSEVLC